MPLVSMRLLLDHAAENDYGLAAFNVNNMEQIQAIMEAADEIDAPVIVQASAGARKYAGEPFLKHLMRGCDRVFPKIPLVMHQDHGNSAGVCKSAIEQDFTSVMMDGSLKEDGKTPADYDYNVGNAEVVDLAHARGVSVEGELGCLGSLESGTAKGRRPRRRRPSDPEQLLTDPTRPKTSSRRRSVDALAVAIGTSHGAYKFTRKPDRESAGDGPHQGDPPPLPQHPPGDARLFERAAGPAGRRSTSIGGEIKQTWGVPVEENSARHQARRAQDQRRHRQPPGHDRRGSQVCWPTRTSSTHATTSSRLARRPG